MKVTFGLRSRRAVLVGAAGLPLAMGIIAGLSWIGRLPDPSLLPKMVLVSVIPMPVDARGYQIDTGTRGQLRNLWVQRDEVSVSEWNDCHEDGGCGFALNLRPGMDPAKTPATGISQPDAIAFVAWIVARTGHPLRLPDLAEWHAVAAPVLPYKSAPIFDHPELDWASAYLLDQERSRAIRPSGSFSTTPAGIRDLDGPVWEWTRDCYAGSDGLVDPAHCLAFFVGGEHIAAIPYLERDPARGGCAVGTPPAHLGMRLVSDRPPPIQG